MFWPYSPSIYLPFPHRPHWHNPTGLCTSHIWSYQEPGGDSVIKMPTTVHWMSSKNSSKPVIPSHILMTRVMIAPFLDALLTMRPQRRHSWGHVAMCIFITLKIPAGSALTSITLWEKKSQEGVLALIYHQLHPKWKAWLALRRKCQSFFSF